MEYPGSHFTRPFRLALLIICIALFCSIAPALILYTIGYRYDAQNGLLKQTGSISIDAVPRQTAVYLNNTELTKNLPLRIATIAPGHYTIRLSATNYYPWEKNIIVNSQQTTYLANIHLLKKSNPAQLQPGFITETAISANGRFLAYNKLTASTTETWLFDTFASSTNLIFKTTGKLSLKLEWAPNNNFLVISSQQPPYDILNISDASRFDNTINVAKLTLEPITKWQWRDTVEPELYYSTKQSLSSLLPITGNQIKITNVSFYDWYMDHGQLWTIKSGPSSDLITIVKDTLGFTKNLATIVNTEGTSTSSFWRFAIAKNDTAALINTKNNELLLTNSLKQWRLQNGKIKISPFQSWWLIISPWELWGYKENNDPTLITRSEKKLLNIEPLDEFNTLALESATNITAIFPYELVEQKLITRPVNSISVDKNERLLYFSDASGLWRLEY